MFALPLPGTAQDRWPVSIEANVGLGSGVSTGAYADRLVGVSGAALVGVRLGPWGSGNFFAAVAFAEQASAFAVEDHCQPGPDGSCLDRFPHFTTLSLLVGREARSTGRRLLMGPAALRADGDWENIRFAWVVRADAASAPLGRVSLTAVAKGFIVPSYEGNSFLMLALGVGLRIR